MYFLWYLGLGWKISKFSVVTAYDFGLIDPEVANIMIIITIYLVSSSTFTFRILQSLELE